MFHERLIGGLTRGEVDDIVGSTSGTLHEESEYLILPISKARFAIRMVPLTRLGTTRTPDGLGTITSKTRPAGIKEALGLLSQAEIKAKNRF